MWSCIDGIDIFELLSGANQEVKELKNGKNDVFDPPQPQQSTITNKHEDVKQIWSFNQGVETFE